MDDSIVIIVFLAIVAVIITIYCISSAIDKAAEQKASARYAPEAEKLKKENENLQKRLIESQATVSTFEKKINDITMQSLSIKEERNTLRRQLTHSSSPAPQKDISQDNESLIAKVQNLTNLLENERESSDFFKNLSNVNESRIDRLKKNLEELKSDLSQHEIEASHLRSLLSMRDRQISSLSNELASQKSEREKLQFQIDFFRHGYDTFNAQPNSSSDIQDKQLCDPSIADRLKLAEQYYLYIKRNNPFFNDGLRQSYIEAFSTNRFDYFLTNCPYDPTEVKLSARIRSSDGKDYYTTSLTSCTCTDFQIRRKPCKHMIKLAIFFNTTYNIQSEKVNPILSNLLAKQQELYDFEKEIAIKKSEIAEQERTSKVTIDDAKQKARRIISDAREEEKNLTKILREKSQAYPWIAEMLSALKVAKYEVNIRNGVTKHELTNLIKDRERKISLLENQLAVWKYSFPVLNELQDVSPTDLADAISDADGTGFIYQWLSEDDYATLTSEEKQQKWIDDYFAKRSKNAWEAGIKYERYIGYLCEKRGYSVMYNGATMKLDDMGRDLIVAKGNKVYLVQCKRYSSSKEIHENSIFQLFGSLCHYESLNPQKKAVGVFVTTTKLTTVATECAKKLGITVYENIELKEYPTIKCNISKAKEHIYHLPYDQQYDKVTINESKGEYYVSTISEAKSLGFRHAYKHYFNS